MRFFGWGKVKIEDEVIELEDEIEELPEIEIQEMNLNDYKPICPHCEKEIERIDEFSGDDCYVYTCPGCHKILSVNY